MIRKYNLEEMRLSDALMCCVKPCEIVMTTTFPITHHTFETLWKSVKGILRKDYGGAYLSVTNLYGKGMYYYFIRGDVRKRFQELVPDEESPAALTLTDQEDRQYILDKLIPAMIKVEDEFALTPIPE